MPWILFLKSYLLYGIFSPLHLITSLRRHITIISSLSKPTTMKPEMILQADVLDIIFDNRNKEYGAYELRSHYSRRLKKSILVIFLSICLVIGASMMIGFFFPESKKIFTLASSDIHIMEIGKTEGIKPEIKAKERI